MESAELNSFLLASTPELEDALQRNLTSNIFDQYDVSWEDEHDQVVCLHSLKHRGTLPATISETVLESCTAVAWNASGSVIAAAYGPLDRNDWELSESMLCTWSVMRRQLDPARADNTLQLSCCLVSLAFHPTDPSLLAGGAFNGDVMLFRLGKCSVHPSPIENRMPLSLVLCGTAFLRHSTLSNQFVCRSNRR